MAMTATSLGDLVGLTVWAPDLVGPTQTANFLVTLRLINRVVEV